MSLSHDWSSNIVVKGFKGLVYLIVFACVFSCHDNIDLYNRPGFDGGKRPSNGGAAPTSAPDYSQQTYGQQPAFAPLPAQQGAAAFRPAPDYYYYQPYYPQQQYQQRPASRYYNNPYSFQPPAQYPYYDTDQYYVPPAAYNPAVEHDSSNAYQGPARGAPGGINSSNTSMH